MSKSKSSKSKTPFKRGRPSQENSGQLAGRMLPLALRQTIVKRFLMSLEHVQFLGIELHTLDETWVTLEVKHFKHHVGNPATGVVHGGVLTTLLDTACGVSVISSLPEIEICPTLDLRVDYVKAAEPELTIFADACSYRISRNIVFTRAFAYQTDRKDPVAHAVAAFMRISPDAVPSEYRDYLLKC